MPGLYHRALQIHSRTPAAVSDEDAGISGEERLEIAREIEEAVSRARIEIGPEAFTLVARRRGFRFPLILNLSAALLLAAGIPVLLWAFHVQEQVFSAGVTAVTGAEGRLLETMREEAERRLGEKDREIADQVRRMSALRSERDRLREDMADRIRAKEKELQDDLERKLRDQRDRLGGRLSEEQVIARLAALEEQLRERLTREVNEFARREQDAAARRELEIERGLESAGTGLEAVRSERGRLADAIPAPAPPAVETAERERETLVVDRLRAIYGSVRTHVAAGDYPRALRELEQLEAVLSPQGIAGLGFLERLRPGELDTAESIRRLIAVAQRQPQPAAADRVLQTVATLADQADRRLRAGDDDGAMSLYTAALAEIPAAGRSHESLAAMERAVAERGRQTPDLLTYPPCC